MRKRRQGFVLLVVLVVLAMAGVILAATARRSGERALRAGEEVRALQRKWGTFAIEAVLLSQAERFLAEAAPQAADEPLVTLHATVRLGEMDFCVLLADEQAKASANTLAARRGDRGLADSLRALQAHVREAPAIRLRPVESPTEAGAAALPRYASLDQLYAVEHPAVLVSPDLKETRAADRVTCWGSGLVNLKRAERGVLREVLAGLVTEFQLDRLDQFRRENPQAGLQELLGLLDLSKEQLELIMPLVTDASYCHSVWVIALGKSRNWYRLSVAATGGGGSGSRLVTFAW